VGHGRGVDGSLHFQIALPVAELIEQPDSLAEKCGDEVDLHLVEKPSVEALLHEARPTGNRDVFVAGGLPSLGERGLEAVRDEDERRAALLRHGFPRVVGGTNTGTRNGGSSPHQPSATGSSSHGPSPPLNMRLPIRTARRCRAFRAPPRRPRSSPLQTFRGARPARKSEAPLVEPIATIAERLLYCPVRAGDETV
jgi:hypothetical protein